MDLKTFLSKITRDFLSDIDNTHVSHAHVGTGLINAFQQMTI
jgi:hypothetical protein